jgi:hypothetical protein
MFRRQKTLGCQAALRRQSAKIAAGQERPGARLASDVGAVFLKNVLNAFA